MGGKKLTVLIDSWAWIEYFRGSKSGEKVKKYIEGKEKAIISAINIAEVYRWILNFYDEKIAEKKIEAMKERCFVIPVDEKIAVMAAKIKHEEKLGLGDAIIYATARKENAILLTGDSDFRNKKNVIFIQ
ncbi:MAG TPA: type II toxin-antitoxin system VapC family toxin [Candidatus Atribacteria bacterium]|nr:type II toxin-antitoxin system VapC family toxin [Candidatus Atribacteria bacterium]